MKHPWVNITLLILLLIQLVNGYLGMLNARETFDWVLWLHGIGAYAIIVLFYWKSSIIWDTFRRKKRWTWGRVGFILTLILLLITLAFGIIWTFNGPIYLWGFSLVSLHIYFAVPMMILMAWHSWKMRFIFRVPEALGRRQFINTAVTTVVGLAVWRTVGWSREVLAVPGAVRRFTGSYERGSFSKHFPSVSWIFDNPPAIDPTAWELVIDGAVRQSLNFTYDQLRQLATDTRTETLDCTGGWYATQEWTGINVARLLEMAGVEEAAASVSFIAISTYQRRFTLREANSFMLALDVAGEPLSHGHGFPLRLVASDKRGVEWVKWITHIRVNTTSKIWQSPLPLK